ncbi:MAG: hypothetical protein KGJ62_12475 [Armatimonadetes bacterium]|nr:hypothetical protein [Armatimonadota bacterium]MDE2207922.1 hypothetical protein [Armatimonadota bacterium]
MRSRILLEGGVATAPPLEGVPYAWRFADGEQIVGIPASRAESAILHAAAKVDADPTEPAVGGPFGTP